MVTIDGSHELSYDGYKLALNGFQNPARDEETEECRKRIGKGIRIKMDDYGNILIKRLCKSGVYIKDWLNPLQPARSTGAGGGVSGSGVSGSGSGGGARPMPSRQQLIKNSQLSPSAIGPIGGVGGGAGGLGEGLSAAGGHALEGHKWANNSAMCDEVVSLGGRLELDKIYALFDMKKFQANLNEELCRPYPSRRKLELQCFSIVGLTRDSDDILNLPCWIMIINIVALEMLYGKFPNFSMDHSHEQLAADTRLHHQQLSHLQHQFNHMHAGPQMSASEARQLETGGYSGNNCSNFHHKPVPSFLSVFNEPNGTAANAAEPNNNNNGQPARQRNKAYNREEDPYSLPANVSSSDVKSSINDYGSLSTKDISSASYLESGNQPARSRLYAGPKDGQPTRRTSAHQLHPQPYPAGQQQQQQASRQRSQLAASNKYQQQAEMARLRSSRSQSNIYGQTAAAGRVPNQRSGALRAERYNNSSSIYSPGHMLMAAGPARDLLPPKLPPRDFVGKKSRSKSLVAPNGPNFASEQEQQNLQIRGGQPPANEETVYSSSPVANKPRTAQPPLPPPPKGSLPAESAAKPARKSKKNRFLESLKAPLELAKSSRSASVMGAPYEAQQNSSSGLEQSSLIESSAKGKMSKASSVVASVASNGHSKASKSGGVFTKSGAKNLRSFLGVGGGKSSNKEPVGAHEFELGDAKRALGQPLKRTSKSGAQITSLASKAKDNGDEADSVVDASEEIDDSQLMATNSNSNSSTASYNDLDIPTPDYGTDENIYSLDNNNSSLMLNSLMMGQQGEQENKGKLKKGSSTTGANGQKVASSNRVRRFSTSQKEDLMVYGNNLSKSNNAHHLEGARRSKDDLYFSGFLAHVPQNIYGHTSSSPNRRLAGSQTRLNSTQQRLNGRSSSTLMQSYANSMANHNNNNDTANNNAANGSLLADEPLLPSLRHGNAGNAAKSNSGNNNNNNNNNGGHGKPRQAHSVKSGNNNEPHTGRYPYRQGRVGAPAGVSAGAREMIYGSAIGLTTATGLRYRSASMQRHYQTSAKSSHYHMPGASSSQQQLYPNGSRHQRSHPGEMHHSLDMIENPYATSGPPDDVPVDYDLDYDDHLGEELDEELHGREQDEEEQEEEEQGPEEGHYGLLGGMLTSRRRLEKKSIVGAAHQQAAPVDSLPNENAYDMGRSSSGIYGNNSSSSSCDYADWHPQVRKVNSSGYLNSIFKTSANQNNALNGLSAQSDLLANSQLTKPLKDNNSSKLNTSVSAYGYTRNSSNNNNKGGNNNNLAAKPSSRQNYSSKAMKSSINQPETNNKNKGKKSNSNCNPRLNALVQESENLVNTTQAYRSYDSSNGK